MSSLHLVIRSFPLPYPLNLWLQCHAKALVHCFLNQAHHCHYIRGPGPTDPCGIDQEIGVGLADLDAADLLAPQPCGVDQTSCVVVGRIGKCAAQTGFHRLGTPSVLQKSLGCGPNLFAVTRCQTEIGAENHRAEARLDAFAPFQAAVAVAIAKLSGPHNLHFVCFVQQHHIPQIVLDLAAVRTRVVDHRAAHCPRHAHCPFQPGQPCVDAGAGCPGKQCAALGKEKGAVIQRKNAAGGRVDADGPAAVVDHQPAHTCVADQHIAAAAQNQIGQFHLPRPTHQTE